ncbi:RES family NAD+ phosphorylase [Sessilibacter corallicola]|uniref:RES domain-containing protein n=1 Tax=Sessilibacter corallicola TaxID=2904075 RepID=A0ABQ0ADP5_9GAMM
MSEEICVPDLDLSDFMLDKAREVLVPIDKLSPYHQACIFDLGSSEFRAIELWELFEDYSGFGCSEFMKKFVSQLLKDKGNQGHTLLYVLDDGSFDEINQFALEWGNFIDSIHHQHRFFNKYGKEYLDKLFESLFQYIQDNPDWITTIDSNTTIFRARIATDEKIRESIKTAPIEQLGPTPCHLATNQRMSPDGISVLYGALNRETCINEIRPLVGDTVVSAEFRALKEIKLLNLNTLEKFSVCLDIFDDKYLQYTHSEHFFKELIFLMSRPAREEHKNSYLPTQIIFEYLSIKMGPELDDLLYSSVQSNHAGNCLALFPNSSNLNRDSVCVLDGYENPFSDSCETLYWVPDSLKFHPIKGVKYTYETEDNDFFLKANKETLKLLSMRRFDK